MMIAVHLPCALASKYALPEVNDTTYVSNFKQSLQDWESSAT